MFYTQPYQRSPRVQFIHYLARRQFEKTKLTPSLCDEYNPSNTRSNYFSYADVLRQPLHIMNEAYFRRETIIRTVVPFVRRAIVATEPGLYVLVLLGNSWPGHRNGGKPGACFMKWGLLRYSLWRGLDRELLIVKRTDASTGGGMGTFGLIEVFERIPYTRHGTCIISDGRPTRCWPCGVLLNAAIGI